MLRKKTTKLGIHTSMRRSKHLIRRRILVPSFHWSICFFARLWQIRLLFMWFYTIKFFSYLSSLLALCFPRPTMSPVWLTGKIPWNMLGQISKLCERSPQHTSWGHWNLLSPHKKNSSNSWLKILSSDFIFRHSMILCWSKTLLVWWNHSHTSTFLILLLWSNSQ